MSRLDHAKAAALILIMTVVAYWPAMRGEFLWDDGKNVSENPLLQSVHGLKQIWLNPRASFQYYPLTYTSHWVEYHFWGTRTLGYHLVNVLIHAANAYLVGLVLTRLSVPGVWLAAALFALHPVQVQSVAWISERKNVLSALFGLCAILAYLHFAFGLKCRWRFYSLALGLFLCALLSKTATVILPLSMLLVLWWKKPKVTRSDLCALLPFVSVGIASALLTSWLEINYGSAQGPEWSLSFWERILIAGRAIWFYVGKLIWPEPLMMVYPRWHIDVNQWWQYLLPVSVVAAIATLWKFQDRFGRGPLVAAIVFVAVLAPTPAFIPIAFMRYSYVADHWQYLPSIGMLALAAASAAKFMTSRWLQPVGFIVLLLLGVLTWNYAHAFGSPVSLWQDNVRKNPEAWVAQYNLGALLADSGKLDEASDHYQQALRVYPNYANAHNNLGSVYLQDGRTGMAIEQFLQAITNAPGVSQFYYNLGLAYARAGDIQAAMEQWKHALALEPDNAAAHYNLGTALAQVGKPDLAFRHLQEAIRIKPGYVLAHFNLGSLLEETGRPLEARKQYEQVLQIRPDFEEARRRLERLRP